MYWDYWNWFIKTMHLPLPNPQLPAIRSAFRRSVFRRPLFSMSKISSPTTYFWSRSHGELRSLFASIRELLILGCNLCIHLQHVPLAVPSNKSKCWSPACHVFEVGGARFSGNDPKRSSLMVMWHANMASKFYQPQGKGSPRISLIWESQIV